MHCLLVWGCWTVMMDSQSQKDAMLARRNVQHFLSAFHFCTNKIARVKGAVFSALLVTPTLSARQCSCTAVPLVVDSVLSMAMPPTACISSNGIERPHPVYPYHYCAAAGVVLPSTEGPYC